MSQFRSTTTTAQHVAATSTMDDEQSRPSSIIQRFIESVDSGDVRTELAEDCVFGLFGRHISGIDSVTGYMRTQLMGRFRHVGFSEAQRCDPEDEVNLRERFGRTFDRSRRRLDQKKDRGRPTTLHLRADSDDEELSESGITQVPCHLVTPPRPAVHIMEIFSYIKAKGMLEPIHDPDDGGINLGDCRQVQLTLAYRREHSNEICLALYEKYRQLRQKSTSVPPTPPTMRPDGTTDIAGVEEHATTTTPRQRSVRRILFASGTDMEECEETDVTSLAEQVPPAPKPSTPASVPSRLVMVTPRKRHRRNEKDVGSKRPAGVRL